MSIKLHNLINSSYYNVLHIVQNYTQLSINIMLRYAYNNTRIINRAAGGIQ